MFDPYISQEPSVNYLIAVSSNIYNCIRQTLVLKLVDLGHEKMCLMSLDSCMKKFDAIKILFYKMTAF